MSSQAFINSATLGYEVCQTYDYGDPYLVRS